MRPIKYVSGLTPAKVAAIMTHFKAIKDLLPTDVKLTPEMRKTLPMVERRRLKFSRKGSHFTRDFHKELMISQEEVDDTARVDFDHESGMDMEEQGKSVVEIISDLRRLAGATLYFKAKMVRRRAHIALLSGVAGVEVVTDSMDEEFYRPGGRPDSEEVDDSPEADEEVADS